MATGSTTADVGTNPEKREAFILGQLDRARRKVRLIELGTGLMMLMAGVLAYLIALAVIDHWIWPLGMIGRWTAMGALLVAMCVFAALRVWPYVAHSIHPLYAAQVIERGTPSLKNSLLNYLFLSRMPNAVTPAIYESMKRTAADDLGKVSPDASVDRSQLIRVLYILTAIMAFCAVYKVLSPKDPFQTVSRVLMPWTNRAAPSRVEILDVTPGHTKANYGAKIEISATVRGVRDSDQVAIVYSTADHQVVDREIPMRAHEDGLRFLAELPPDEHGLRQDLAYRVRAGDAISPAYRIELETEPLIVVRQIELTYPAYAQRPTSRIEGLADIEALEGTRVTLNARANKPIREAHIEWDPDQTALPGGTLALEHHGLDATGTFTLSLTPDHKRPIHGSYQLRFTTEDGQTNESPPIHRITVVPDMPPVVDILNPKTRKLELPENGSHEIEVRAVDPDYGLKRLVLRGTTAAGAAWEQPLLEDAAGVQGQQMAKHRVRPAELGWKQGEVVIYRAAAYDNRQSADGREEPNESLTAEYQIVVTAPQDHGQPPDQPSDERPPTDMPQDELAKPSADIPENKDKDQDKEKVPGKDQDKDKGKDNDNTKNENENKNNENQGSESKDSESKDSGSKESGSKSGDKKSDQQASSGSGEGQPNEQAPSASGGAGEGKPSDPSQEGRESSESPSPGESGKPGSRDQEPRRSGQGTEAAREPNQDLHDGDVFDTVQRHMQRQKSSEPASDQRTNNEKPPGANPADDQARATDNTAKPSSTGDPQSRDVNDGARKNTGDESNSQAKDGTQDKDKDKANAARDNRPDASLPNEKDAASQTANDKSLGGDKPGNPTPPIDRDGEDKPAGDQPAGDKPTGDKPTGDKPTGDKPTGDKPAGDKPAGDKPTGDKPTVDKPDGSKPAGDQPTGDKPTGDKPTGDKPTGDQPAGDQPAGDKPTGDKPTGDKPAGDKPAGDKPAGGKPTGDKPAGDQPAADKPAADKPTGDKPTGDKPAGDQPAGGKSAGDKPTGDKPTGDKPTGDQPAGDKPGGGKPAGDKSGTPKPGENTGNGEVPGDVKPNGEVPQGTKANESSPPGSQPRGDQPPANPQDGNQPQGNQPQGNQPQGSDVTGPSDPRGLPEGGGRPGEGVRVEKSSSPPPAPPPEVEPDLNYTRKATDLALEYLKDQRQEPNSELLEDLGWTKEQLDDFVRRWENLKRAASQDGAAKGQLDETLKSLGLRPPKDAARGGEVKDDSRRGMTEGARHSVPPRKYQEQFNAFRKGAARSADADKPTEAEKPARADKP